MRIALISDIHANLVSFNAVLADLAQNPVDEILFLGDLATLGPQPHAVVARLQALNCVCIMGNHDAYVLDPDSLTAYSDARWFIETVGWSIEQLTPADLDFIRTFRPRQAVVLDPAHPRTSQLLCFHGSPRRSVDIILATTPKKKLRKMLKGHQAPIMAGGHTHVQMMRQFKGTMLINAGSVGMPFRQSPFKHTPRILPWAEYAVVGWRQGALNVDLRRVPVDMDAVMQAALDSTMPDRLDWVNNWQSLRELW